MKLFVTDDVCFRQPANGCPSSVRFIGCATVVAFKSYGALLRTRLGTSPKCSISQQTVFARLRNKIVYTRVTAEPARFGPCTIVPYCVVAYRLNASIYRPRVVFLCFSVRNGRNADARPDTARGTLPVGSPIAPTCLLYLTRPPENNLWTGPSRRYWIQPFPRRLLGNKQPSVKRRRE